MLWGLAPAAWGACVEDADCADGEVCDLGACLAVASPVPAEPEPQAPAPPEEPPLAVPLQSAPTPSPQYATHPGLSYAESAWNQALRSEIESWILVGLTFYGGLNVATNIQFMDPGWGSLQILGIGGLLTYGVVTSWKGAKAGRAGLSRLGLPYDGSVLEQVSWGMYATSLGTGALAIVAMWLGQYEFAQVSSGLALVAAMGGMGVMQAESIRTRRMLSDRMDVLDPGRRQVQLAPVLGPVEGGMTMGLAATF